MILDPIKISILLLGVAILILLFWVWRLNRKINSFRAGGIGNNLPEVLDKFSEKLRHAENFENETIKFLRIANSRINRSIQAIGLVRFSAFRDGGGGGQSFAIALLNEEGSGLVISSLYNRDHVGVYSKPIQKFSSKFDLSEEEKTAVSEAKKNLTN